MYKLSKFLSSVKDASHLRFKDRDKAGSVLAEVIKDRIKNTDFNDVVIIGIARGGIVISDIVANKLNAKFEFIVPRKLRAPHNEELAIGAVIDAGNPVTYIDDRMVKKYRISDDYINSEKVTQIEEIKRREMLYPSKLGKHHHIKKTAILVDDGAAMGATMVVSSRWVKNLKPERLMIAIPVAPSRTIELLKKEAESVEVLVKASDSTFKTIGTYYQNFPPVSDEIISNILRKNSY